MARPNWMVKGSCLKEGLDWLEKPVQAQIDDCMDCPVRLQCLLYAVETAASGVVYGGIHIRDGRPLREA